MSFKNTSHAVSAKLTFPCTECNFEAQSARQLSRHKAVTHTQNALKCVLCPFVTAYQTNLLRHRKDVHGICGSKGNKSCKFCGFVSEDNDTLIQHQIEYHQDILKSAQVKFAKELVSAGGDESIADFSTNFESMNEDYFSYKGSMGLLKSAKKKANAIKLQQQQQQQQQQHLLLQHQQQINSVTNQALSEEAMDERNDFDDFWKAGFMEQLGEQEMFYGNQQGVMSMVEGQNDSERNTSSRSSTPKSHSSHNFNPSLPATRIRRQYTCTECGFRTVNPREFLYHRRDSHGHKIKIVECPHCVYACQYVQKLQRHLLLVHKLPGSSDANGEMDGFKRRFKRDFDASLLDQDQDYDPNLDEEDNHDDELDFEHINNFEMNFNEFAPGNGNIDFDEQDQSVSNEAEKKILFNLECFLCKIKFGDVMSAQKHFLKYHQDTQSKALMSVMRDESSVDSPLVSTSQRKVFDGDKTVHTCSFCGYKTRWISELERHVRVHSKEKPFKCLFCDFRSKWKGDLNRHIQRYHSSEQNLPELESDASAHGSQHTGDLSPAPPSITNYRPDEDNLNDSSLVVDDGTGSVAAVAAAAFAAASANCDGGGGETHEASTADHNNEGDNEDSMQSPNGNTAKMYKCTYCDFMCSTASRFHVHYVQHLNTKPFQCSICGHRSNWEWDVTKHIKMKAQRDPNHEKARPVLIHDSGKRDYSKYNKFVVWVGQAEADLANSESNKIDFRAKRFRAEVDNGPETNEPIAMDSLLTPEVCFEVDGEINEVSSSLEQTANFLSDSTQNYIADTNGVSMTAPIKSAKQVAKSVVISRHRQSHGHPITCLQCEFRHHFARVMVAHMSSHANQKPYYCKNCSFDTNWREVMVSHMTIEHNSCHSLDFEMRFRCFIDENGYCRVMDNDEVLEFEAANSESMEFSQSATANDSNSSLIEPNIYEEKAVIRCESCPFITTNLKKMNIHCRFHNPSKGSLKCKYCPYYVNSRDKLIRHQKLHQKVDLSAKSNQTTVNQASFSKRPWLISCSLCPYQAKSHEMLNEHMKVHDNTSDCFENMLEQVLTTENEDDLQESFGELSSTDNSVSMVNVNHMKNGAPKRFSYVCPDCPAAFKSPGDYKIHAVFHQSDYQHACPYCTYRARNKPQLCKHLYVHTAEYIAKRADSYPEGTKHKVGDQESHANTIAEMTIPPKFSLIKPPGKAAVAPKMGVKKHRTKIKFPMKPVKVKLNSEENGNQKIVFNNTSLMNSQEFLETKEYLQRINSGIKNRCMYRCSKCPAVFTKVNTLIYHMTLHDQSANHTCDSCSYSCETEDNLSIHSLLHNLTESQTALGYKFNYNCHKCPAGFSKRSRLEKHLSLHGAKFNWRCNKCDYSVRYAATLVKHRALHLINPDFQAIENYANGEDNPTYSSDLSSLNEGSDNRDSLLPNNLKLMLNLSQLNSDGLTADDGDNSDIPVDEDNTSQDLGQDEDDIENESLEDTPVPVMMLEEELIEDEDDESDVKEPVCIETQ